MMNRTLGVPIAVARWLPLAACCLGTFLLLLYTTVVTVALPAIGTGIGAGFGEQQWIVDVYPLALAGLVLGAAAIGDSYGARRLYLLGLAGFTAATLLCAVADSPVLLIAGRAVQGLCGAAMFATIVPLIGAVYREPKSRAQAFAVWGAVAGSASAIGTAGGGLVTEFVGWRWLFLAALPLCAVAIIVAVLSLPCTPRAGVAPSVPVDWPGIVLVSLAVTMLAYAVIDAGESGLLSPSVLIALVVAVGAGVALGIVEIRGPHPMLPAELLSSRSFGAVVLAAFGYYFAAFGALPALARWLQSDRGLSPSWTSLTLVVQLAVFIAVSGLVSSRLSGIGHRWTLGLGTLAVGCGALLGGLVAQWPVWASSMPFLVLSGAGAGIVSPVLPAAAMAAAPARLAGVASGAANASRQLGLTLGVAVCGGVASAGNGDASATGVAMALVVSALVAIASGVAVLILA